MIRLAPLSLVLLALVSVLGVVQLWQPQAGPPIWRYLGLIYLAGLLYEWLRVRRVPLTLSAGAQRQLSLGVPETLDLMLHNADLRPRMIEYALELPPEVDLVSGQGRAQVEAGGEQTLHATVLGQSLGNFALLPVPLRVRGNLGLAWWPKRLSVDMALVVIPDARRVSLAPSSRHPSGTVQSAAGHAVEIYQQRDYQPGDALRAINWKATARNQKLITRVYSEETRPSIFIVLDIGRTSFTRIQGLAQFGHYVNLAATFAGAAIAAGEDVGLIVAAGAPQVLLPPSRGEKAMTQFNRALRQLRPALEETDLMALSLQVDQAAKTRSLIVLCTDLYNNRIEGDLGRALALWSRRHQPLLVGLVGEQVYALSQEAARSDREAYNSLAAAEYCRGLEATGQAARRSGARVVISSPGELNQGVISEFLRLRAQRRI